MLKKIIIALAVVTFSVGFSADCEANTPPPQSSCACKFSDEQFDALKNAAYSVGRGIDRFSFETAKSIAATIPGEFVIFFWQGFYRA